MNAPWPTGPDGFPLPAAPNGQPLWPSEQYRQAYESGQAQHRAAADQRWKVWRILIVLAVIIFAIWQLSLAM